MTSTALGTAFTSCCVFVAVTTTSGVWITSLACVQLVNPINIDKVKSVDLRFFVSIARLLHYKINFY